VNSGGEPERDEYGLPPVDIEIPDDARELDRDVQAYHRELRAERRRQRRHRLHGSLARDGIVLPLLACCLILALITGTLLTVFTATSDPELAPRTGTGKSAGHPASGTSPSGARSPAHRASSPRIGAPSTSPTPAKSGRSSGAAAVTPGIDISQVGASLPVGNLVVDGRAIPLRSLSGAMLVLLTPNCRCSAAVRWVAGLAYQQGALIFIVGTPTSPTTVAEANQYWMRLSPAQQQIVSVASDPQDVLYATYPPEIGASVVLVADDSSSVWYASRLSPGDQPAPLIAALHG
jgi:hypothetical protein